MKQKVIIIGGVGSGTVVAQAMIDAINRGNQNFEFSGFLNDRQKSGELIEGLPVLGNQTKEEIEKYNSLGYKFIYVLHKQDDEKKFIDKYYSLGLNSDKMFTFIHPTAYVAPDVTIEAGSVIMPYVMISSHATISLNTLIMTGATIGHNTVTGKFNHIASQAVVGAYIKMGEGVHIGLNSTIREYLTIGSYSILGMGSVLTKNILEKEVWVGNPAKKLRNTIES